jgi:hypothetical protein
MAVHQGGALRDRSGFHGDAGWRVIVVDSCQCWLRDLPALEGAGRQ